ncbi:MAG: DUF354 domain-containing protein [Crocinitomicaceae bacterium]|nr:DUF354 domain-containing protein [Crocinitomicaceae bacterium]
MARVGLYAGLYQNKGVGHIVRTASLYHYLESTYFQHEFHFATNDPAKTKPILENFEIFADQQEINSCDVLLLDSPEDENDLLDRVEYKRLIRLDFFDYLDNRVDVIINLFNHNPITLTGSAKIYEGLDYTILKDEVLNAQDHSESKTDKKLSKVLVAFSGNDPANNTIKAVQRMSSFDVRMKVVCPSQKSLNDYVDYADQAVFIAPTSKFGMLLADCDLFICAGGTALVEALFLGKPILAIAQNVMEKRFIEYVGGEVKIYTFDDVEDISNNYGLIENSTRKEYRKLVDGKGKERIGRIILNLLGEE